MYSYKNKQSGFSLVEIVLVFAMTAIIVTISTSNLFGVRNKYALNTTAEKIVFDLRLARENARGQKDGTAWGVRLNNDSNGKFFEVFSGDSYASGTKSLRTALSSGVKFVTPAEGTNADIIFAKVTGLPASSYSITIGSESITSITKIITINANGTITY
ncbi:MAG TPA: prepilin-type N-terminal cleavage/methylation domain-containing protein [Candidatus Colwellbacteria bacterium]|nr:prepilin-type N-terminal cleavage/methylation domain-containing protein [Candidatus Colwellbacteria bacterium]HQA96130.1 prepilin-type N-terminal cleavage/methylation domain-containing protein [Candidatus Colwellbacteria bacterium]